MEAIENIKSQMKKGVMELCVLSIIHTQEAYPGDVIEGMSNVGIDVPEGTLYPILTRLKNAGYLQYQWVESTEGPPRKYFSLTTEGKGYLKQLKKGWAEFASSINQLLNK
jgi:PadR family transcriptional regulator, regulatory protein PadR